LEPNPFADNAADHHPRRVPSGEEHNKNEAMKQVFTAKETNACQSTFSFAVIKTLCVIA
jgi:hypothetical protein